MRTILSALAAALLVAGLASVAGAEAQQKGAKAKQRAPATAQAAAQPRNNSGYVEYLADKMPFGSVAWWEQMRREGRLGGEVR